MRSWAHLAATLTQPALAAQIGMIERNRPGVREMYVPVAGSLEAVGSAALRRLAGLPQQSDDFA